MKSEQFSITKSTVFSFKTLICVAGHSSLVIIASVISSVIII